MSALPVRTAEPRSTTLLLHCPLRLGLAAVIGDGPDIEWSLHAPDEVSRIAAFVSKEDKAEVEGAQPALLRRERLDLVVLARYMRIVTGRFVEEYPNRTINIRHKIIVHKGRTVVFD